MFQPWIGPLDTLAPASVDPKLRETASEVLRRLAIGPADEQISFARIIDELGERGFGLLIIIFALPNCIPFPGVPGVSFVTGIAILYISIQLILARDEPALPHWVAAKSFSRGQLARFVAKTSPLLRWLERPIKPRLTPMVAGVGERAIGVLGLIHAITLALPIPMGNLPQGVALILLALALLELDGLMALAGYVASLIAVAWIGAVVLGMGGLVIPLLT